MKLSTIPYLLLLYLLLPIDASAGTYDLTDKDDGVWLNMLVEGYADTEASLTIDQVVHKEFTPNSNTILYYPRTPSAFWTRYTIHNPYDTPMVRWLSLDDPFIDTLKTYSIDEHNTQLIDITGRKVSLSKRALRYHIFVVPVTIPPKKTITIYHRHKSSEVVTMAIELWNPELFQLTNQKKMLAYGLFYGVALTIFLTVLITFIVTREKVYLNYSFFLATMHIYFTLSGHGFIQFLFLSEHIEIGSYLHLHTLSLGFLAGLLLIRSFQPYTFKNRFWEYFFQSQIYILLLLLIVPYVFTYRIGSNALTYFSILPMLSSLGLLIFKAKIGDLAAKLFLGAWVVHLTGGTFILLTINGLMQNEFLSNYGYMTCLTIELILISTAISMSIMQQRKSKVRAQKEAYRNLQKSVEAQKSELQTQIEPHFLFNILSSISQLIKQNPDFAEESICRLSDFYRNILESSKDSLITVQEELQALEQYIALQKIRYGESIRYTTTINETLSTYKIPGFILQPLVENSIKYGIGDRTTGVTISVSVNTDTDTDAVVIKVTDDGPGFKPTGSSTGLGLENVRKRLNLYYDNKAQLNIYSDQGVTIELVIQNS
ncbi:MAG: histidine kinase [Fibrobacterales bacterium]